MDVKKTYRMILKKNELPDTSSYGCYFFAKWLLNRFNECFGTSRELISIYNDDDTEYDLIPLFNHDGTDSTSFYIGTYGNDSSSFHFNIFGSITYDDKTYYYEFPTTNAYSFNIHNDSAVLSPFSASYKAATSYTTSTITFSPVPNGYMVNGMVDITDSGSGVSDYVPIFGFYFLQGMNNDGSTKECVIRTVWQDTQIYVYPAFTSNWVTSPMLKYVPIYQPTPRDMTADNLVVCKIMGDISFDVYFGVIRWGDRNSTIGAKYVQGQHEDSNIPLIDMFNYDDKTYLSSLHPLTNTIFTGAILVFNKDGFNPEPPEPELPDLPISFHFGITYIDDDKLFIAGGQYGGTKSYYLGNNVEWVESRELPIATNTTLGGSVARYDGSIYLCSSQPSSQYPYVVNFYYWNGESWTAIFGIAQSTAHYIFDYASNMYLTSGSKIYKWSGNGFNDYARTWTPNYDEAFIYPTTSVEYHNLLYVFIATNVYTWNGSSGTTPFIKTSITTPFNIASGVSVTSVVVYNDEIHILLNAASLDPDEQHYAFNGTTWRKASSMPFVSQYMCSGTRAIVYNNKIHLMGWSDKNPNLAEFYVHYCWDGNEWSKYL